MTIRSFLSLCLLGFSVGAVPVHAEDSSPIRQGPQRLVPGDHDIGRMIVDATFNDLSGSEHSLYSLVNRHQATVIAITSTSCPLSQKYLPTLISLAKKYSDHGIGFVVINPISTDDQSAMRDAQDSFETTATYVFDKHGSLAEHLGADTTTDVFVIDRSRTIVYHGAVDDQYGFGYARRSPRQNLLSDAIESILQGQSPEIEATDAPGCKLSVQERRPAVAGLTYYGRIARLMQRHCVECHRDGGVGPFPLDSFQDVIAHAPMIREVVQRRTMPPWFAATEEDGGVSRWANDRSLSDNELNDLQSWIDGDMAKGDPADAPQPLQFPDGWLIGRPDKVFGFDRPIAVQATGVMPYKHRVVETDLEEDKWVQAIEIRPSVAAVVHHVLVTVEPPVSTDSHNRRRESGIDYWGLYVPGNSTRIYPAGYGRLLPKGSRLRFQMHYTPNGTATEDRTRIGLVFARQRPDFEVKTESIVNPKIEIPPYAGNHMEFAQHPVPSQLHILGYAPHHHLRGKACRYELISAAGDSKMLLDIPRYDFNWQLFYRYSEPLIVQAGDAIKYTAWYDNSESNPANPMPSETIGWGEQTDDEMHIGYIEYSEPVARDTDSNRRAADRRGNRRDFDVIDSDGDGFVARNEIRQIGGTTPHKKQDQIFDRYDRDEDGKLDRSEYERLLEIFRR